VIELCKTKRSLYEASFAVLCAAQSFTVFDILLRCLFYSDVHYMPHIVLVSRNVLILFTPTFNPSDKIVFICTFFTVYALLNPSFTRFKELINVPAKNSIKETHCKR
jgi:predicted MPP superfamily phosphohydrolase